jgi:hypothetical protein
MRMTTSRCCSAIAWISVFSMATACVGPVQASEPRGSEGKISATLQSLDIPAARLTFRDTQTTEVRTLHVSNRKALKRMAKLKQGQELSLKYRQAAGATEPEIIGMAQPGDGWKRGIKITVAIGAVFGLLVLGALLFGTD